MAMLSPGYKYEAQIILLAKIGRRQPVQFSKNVTIHTHYFLKKIMVLSLQLD